MKKVLIILFSLILACSGCTASKPQETIKSAKAVNNEVVSLSDVIPPVWAEPFAYLNQAQISIAINWGEASDVDSGYFLESSGFPGFEHPLIIVVPTLQDLSDSKVSLVTDYGTYHYDVIKKFDAALNDSHSNVIYTKDATEVVNFGKSEENLVIVSIVENKALLAKFATGPRIQI